MKTTTYQDQVLVTLGMSRDTIRKLGVTSDEANKMFDLIGISVSYRQSTKEEKASGHGRNIAVVTFTRERAMANVYGDSDNGLASRDVYDVSALAIYAALPGFLASTQGTIPVQCDQIVLEIREEAEENNFRKEDRRREREGERKVFYENVQRLRSAGCACHRVRDEDGDDDSYDSYVFVWYDEQGNLLGSFQQALTMLNEGDNQ